jgi:2-oxoisovalerate dehydrogenase E1 component
MTARQKEKYTIDKEQILEDYLLAFRSRQVSLIGRREVLTGNAKFGIFGDGKELAQIALSKFFEPGDFRSGYYRDQTLMFANNEHSYAEFFAQLFADPSLENEPATSGRAMNAHFATRSLNEDGSWKDLTKIRNTAADLSPTAGHMPRIVGLGLASKLFREGEGFDDGQNFSVDGNEIVFGTIGNASCSEGLFWETVNAISVLDLPVVLSIWDDGYGISVPNEIQFSKSLSDLLSGFERGKGNDKGYDIYKVPAWDYEKLVSTYALATKNARESHVPSIIHVFETTQPQGHSTSGSHERYKSEERLIWEKEFDCVSRFRKWIIEKEIATEKEMVALDKESIRYIENIRVESWARFKRPIKEKILELSDIVSEIAPISKNSDELIGLVNILKNVRNPYRRHIAATYQKIVFSMRREEKKLREILQDWNSKFESENDENISSHLFSESKEKFSSIVEIPPIYAKEKRILKGYEILNIAFDDILERDSRVVAFGEDVGKIGGVNQAFAGLQAKYGKSRVADTGIREATIMGQAIGLALRGFRPIAEIQYLDYILYGLQLLSDDLATLQWRTKGGQKAPVIIRTRGHRLEGIWHSGSPMAGIINLVRGIHVLVPRNMVQAVGFYNSLLKIDEPAIMVEVLNGYRKKETAPDNLKEFTIPLGVPEVIKEGFDISIVTYGPLCDITKKAAALLEEVSISAEIIDIRSLLPFDINHTIVESIKKTNRVLFLDEDVPGGATAFMMQKVLDEQGGYRWLDADPKTLTAKEHRPAYGADGGYWSKPNEDTIFKTVYLMMNEADPKNYPDFFNN